MNYGEVEGERYTVLARSGSDRLYGIIDRVLAPEAGESLAPATARHEITSPTIGFVCSEPKLPRDETATSSIWRPETTTGP
jgi:hypothetical protein